MWRWTTGKYLEGPEVYGFWQRGCYSWCREIFSRQCNAGGLKRSQISVRFGHWLFVADAEEAVASAYGSCGSKLELLSSCWRDIGRECARKSRNQPRGRVVRFQCGILSGRRILVIEEIRSSNGRGIQWPWYLTFLIVEEGFSGVSLFSTYRCFKSFVHKKSSASTRSAGSS